MILNPEKLKKTADDDVRMFLNTTLQKSQKKENELSLSAT